jgi:hypothetical protein
MIILVASLLTAFAIQPDSDAYRLNREGETCWISIAIRLRLVPFARLWIEPSLNWARAIPLLR